MDAAGVKRQILSPHRPPYLPDEAECIRAVSMLNDGSPYERVRHYFFDMGNDRPLAFFEIPKGNEPAGNRNAIGAMQHCAFVVTPERFRKVEARLSSRGIDYLGPIPQLPGLLGIYFYDPNGIRLEFACQPEDGEAPSVIPCITQTKAEARAELETLPDAMPEWIERRLGALPG
jgi:catechol 2,3-dioxygenase-like lactoylglutathione lyase family enzyme